MARPLRMEAEAAVFTSSRGSEIVRLVRLDRRRLAPAGAVSAVGQTDLLMGSDLYYTLKAASVESLSAPVPRRKSIAARLDRRASLVYILVYSVIYRARIQ